MLSRGGVKGVGRNTLGSLVTRGNQVCRYTMLTRPPRADASAILGASGAAKMPFYEAADHAALASPHRSSTIYTPPYSPREPMDRVRRCCTGEMFQPTRLKGQLTPCLAPLASKLPALSTPYRPYVPPLFCLYPIPIPSSHHRVPMSVTLVALVFPFRLILPAIRVFCCHVRITIRSNVDVTAVMKNEKNLFVHTDTFWRIRGMRDGCETIRWEYLIQDSQDISFCTVRFAAGLWFLRLRFWIYFFYFDCLECSGNPAQNNLNNCFPRWFRRQQ